MKPLISLDVFDTALFRKVYSPLDIFTIVEDSVGCNFREVRIEAQRKAREKNLFHNLIDIYKEMKVPFNPKEEVKAEYDNCKANPYILDMYNKEEADFIFISDMYLPSTVIKSMLERCGYKNATVFVSCELGASKGSGKLFLEVEKILGKKISKHIGDSQPSDIKGAQKACIPVTEYVGPPVYHKSVITPEIKNVKLRKLLIDCELSDVSIEEKIGYTFAPMVLAFTKSVLDEATYDQTVFFNARDSFIMYVVARWLLRTDKKIKYCRFSRRSSLIPSIDINKGINDLSNRLIIDFLKLQKCKSIREFLRIYRLDENKNYNKVLSPYSVNIDTDLTFNLNRNKIIEEIVKFAENDLIRVAVAEKKEYLKYVQSLGMKNNDVFVDIGYNGSLQAMLKRTAGLTLKGRYLNVFNTNQEYKGIKIEKKGFFDYNFFSSRGGVAEMVLSEPSGTVYFYINQKPIKGLDKKLRKSVTKKILKGILRGVKDILVENIEVDKEDCRVVVDRFLSHPTVEEAAIANEKLFENGSKENNSLTWFDETMIKEGRVKEAYDKSYWKEAFKVLLEDYKNKKEDYKNKKEDYKGSIKLTKSFESNKVVKNIKGHENNKKGADNMKYLVYLNNYNIRQMRAQYLWVLYEVLSHNLKSHYILNEEYLRDYNKNNSWEVRQAESKYGSFEELWSRFRVEDYTVMKKPEELIKGVENMAPSEILQHTVRKGVPTQVETIEQIVKENKIKAGVTWVNNICLKETLAKFNIPVIHHELGPFRPELYIPTVYLDFSGVNGDTEFDERFKEFLKISHEVPLLSRKELIRVLSPLHYSDLYKVLDNTKNRTYDIGVGLQVEIDTNLLLFNNGRNWVDPVLAAKADSKRKVLVRPHPAANYIMKPDSRMEIDDISKSSAIEFINKCNKIYCLNSSIGLEAILLGRKAKIFGDSPFKNVCKMNEDMQMKALNFTVFGYLTHRDLLFDDEYYSFRLQHRGDEKSIYLDNVKRLLSKARNIKF